MRRIVMLVVCASLAAGRPLAGQIAAEAGPVYTDLPTAAAVGPDEAERWIEDLEALAHDLVVRHADAFHTVTRERFEAAVDSLRDRLPSLSRHEIIVGFGRIGALIGDGHTGVPFLFDPAAGFRALPARLGWYTDGIWVEAADRDLAGIVGTRVVAIGDVAIEEAIARVTPLIARDNDIWIRVMAPLLLARTEVLHALGLSDDPMLARLTVRDGTEERTVEVRALDRAVQLRHGQGRLIRLTRDWIDALGADPPVWLRRSDAPYWWTPLPDEDAVYFQYNQVRNVPHGPTVEQALGQALAFVDTAGVELFVLDVRNNNGGEGMLNRDVVLRILRSPINERGRFFVITGARTFSAAQALVHELEHWTEAVFIGEPTGSAPRFYGDHRLFRLPHSGLLASASPTWWQPGGPYDRRPFLPPDVAAEPAFDDYRLGRDPALEAALEWDSRATLHDALAGPLERGDDEAAAAALRAWARDPAQRYASVTAEANALGYRLARTRGWVAALAVFRANVDVHPDYANGWDSLGEALLELGRTAEGLAAYRRAYELDPKVGRAAAVLRRHGLL